MNKNKEQGGTYNPTGLPESAATTVTGKPIMPEEPAEKAAIEHKERLYKAIAMLSDFINGFSGIAPEDYKIRPEEIADQTDKMKMYRIELLKRKNKETGEILSLRENPAELFKRQYTKKELNTPGFNRKLFAALEKKRAQAAYRMFEDLPDLDAFYKENPQYELVRGYIMYLDEILGQKQPEGSTVNSNALPTDWDVTDLEKLFDRCSKEGLTLREEKKKFVSMFTTGPTGPVTWRDKKVRGARTALFYIMFQITRRVFLPSELNALFKPDVKLSPHNCTLNDGKKPHSIIGKRLCAGIKGGT